ncbi:MAG: DNA polymerase III subunit chi [Rhodocyclaceae bacterium]|nr:DNA polymerase III subunit chi [Rhodocyclaceae bacterium]
MTRIEFYHGAGDKLQAACRLVGDLYAEGRRVLIYAPAADAAAAIDRLLWSQPATGFVPHCRTGEALAGETPVLIGASLDDERDHDVLVNLDGELPPSFARFEQLIEIVGSDEADRIPARERFKFYRDRGYPLQAHQLSP